MFLHALLLHSTTCQLGSAPAPRSVLKAPGHTGARHPWPHRPAPMKRRRRDRGSTGSTSIDVIIDVLYHAHWTFIKSPAIPTSLCLAGVHLRGIYTILRTTSTSTSSTSIPTRTNVFSSLDFHSSLPVYRCFAETSALSTSFCSGVHSLSSLLELAWLLEICSRY